MSTQIISESQFFLISIFSGIVITFLYDLLKIIRNVIKHNGFFIAVEDICYWVVSAAFIFTMLYKVNNGIIRWFFIAGAGLGMVIYKKSVGPYIVHIMSTVINGILDVVKGVLKFVFSPLKWLINKVISIFRKLVMKLKKVIKYIRNRLTNAIKKVSILLCKQKNKHNDGVDI